MFKLLDTIDAWRERDCPVQSLNIFCPISSGTCREMRLEGKDNFFDSEIFSEEKGCICSDIEGKEVVDGEESVSDGDGSKVHCRVVVALTPSWRKIESSFDSKESSRLKSSSHSFSSGKSSSSVTSERVSASEGSESSSSITRFKAPIFVFARGTFTVEPFTYFVATPSSIHKVCDCWFFFRKKIF